MVSPGESLVGAPRPNPPVVQRCILSLLSLKCSFLGRFEQVSVNWMITRVRNSKRLPPQVSQQQNRVPETARPRQITQCADMLSVDRSRMPSLISNLRLLGRRDKALRRVFLAFFLRHSRVIFALNRIYSAIPSRRTRGACPGEHI